MDFFGWIWMDEWRYVCVRGWCNVQVAMRRRDAHATPAEPVQPSPSRSCACTCTCFSHSTLPLRLVFRVAGAFLPGRSHAPAPHWIRLWSRVNDEGRAALRNSTALHCSAASQTRSRSRRLPSPPPTPASPPLPSARLRTTPSDSVRLARPCVRYRSIVINKTSYCTYLPAPSHLASLAPTHLYVKLRIAFRSLAESPCSQRADSPPDPSFPQLIHPVPAPRSTARTH